MLGGEGEENEKTLVSGSGLLVVILSAAKGLAAGMEILRCRSELQAPSA